MTKKETLALLNYLFEKYPESKKDELTLAESWYGSFQNYKPHGILYLCETYIKEGGRYFPNTEEILQLRKREVTNADFVLKDPRNPYYQKVSVAAGTRRQEKITKALWILKALESTSLNLLN